MGRSLFEREEFLRVALRLVDEGGPPAVTVGSLARALAAPTGSFYHRFGSRDELLAELWLEQVRAFQAGFFAALDSGDGLAAALHTPAWARAHPAAARLLLIHHRDDFVKGGWPAGLRANVQAQADDVARRLARYARAQFASTSAAALRRASFVLVDLPTAAVRPHLHRREPVPAVVDELVRTAYVALTEPVAPPRTGLAATPPRRRPRR